MSGKYILFCIALLSFNGAFAQSSFRNLGSGIAIQFGINPKSDFITWDIENTKYNVFPRTRFNLGPTFQFRSYEKVQIEFSIQYGQSNYYNFHKGVPLLQDIKITEWKLPIGVNYNVPSPVKFHSSFVYQFGFLANYQIISPQGKIQKTEKSIVPAIYAGVRLASEIKSFGRFEYGVSYTRNFGSPFTFEVIQDDALPAQVTVNQKTGQININFIYYITPRVFNWSANRYKMEGSEVID